MVNGYDIQEIFFGHIFGKMSPGRNDVKPNLSCYYDEDIL